MQWKDRIEPQEAVPKTYSIHNCWLFDQQPSLFCACLVWMSHSRYTMLCLVNSCTMSYYFKLRDVLFITWFLWDYYQPLPLLHVTTSLGERLGTRPLLSHSVFLSYKSNSRKWQLFCTFMCSILTSEKDNSILKDNVHKPLYSHIQCAWTVCINSMRR